MQKDSKSKFVKRSDSKFDSKSEPKGEAKPFVKSDAKTDSSKPYFKAKERKGDPLPTFNDDEIRLNKYLSNAGVCSRRRS